MGTVRFVPPRATTTTYMPASRVLPRPPRWTSRAECRGLVSADDDPWHPGPEVSQQERREAYEVARRVCGRCPVIEQCREYGIGLLAAGDVRGMFGGLTPGELRALAKGSGQAARKVAQHGTRARYVGGCRCPECRRANSRGEHERRLWVVEHGGEAVAG